MRLFTALELPAAIRNELAAVQVTLKPRLPGRLSWTAAANLHVTLKFLGEVSETQAPTICEALRAVPIRPMTLILARLGALPPRGPARVLMAELNGDVESLAMLFAAIEQACRPLGFSADNRKFRPHITLARLRQPRRIDREIESVTLKPIDFEVSDFVLMQSTLDARGAIYTPIARFK